MNAKKTNRGALALLSTGILVLPSSLFAQRVFSTANTVISEDFSSYTGTSTLPADFSVETGESPIYFRGFDNGSSSAPGFRAYARGTPGTGDVSFGIFEGSNSNGTLSDSRLFLSLRNETGTTVTRLRVSYDVTQWRDGQRLNRIRLKYNNVNSGWGSLADLVNTQAPQQLYTGTPIVLDGNLVKTPVTAVFDLVTPLGHNQNGLLRWQYSSSNDSGNRDGLGITNVQVEIVPDAPALVRNASGEWSDSLWGSGGNVAWNDGDRAVLATSGISVEVDDEFVVNGIDFTANNATLVDSLGFLSLNGPISVSGTNTALIEATLDHTLGDYQDFVKLGTGSLTFDGTATIGGDIRVLEGSLTIGANASVSPTARVELGGATTFVVDRSALTVRGLFGADTGTVDIDGATLTLDQGGSNVSYRGAIVGAGSIVKTGAGLQEFQTTAKTYTGNTSVDQGTLALTINGLPTHTAGVFVYGPETAAAPTGYGELLLNRAGTYLIGSALGSAPSITLDGGWLASDTNLSVSLQNPIVLMIPTDVDDDAQGRPDLGNQIYARGATGLLQLNGAITGSGGFRKQAQGELVLANAGNTYSGGTNLRRGTLTVPATGSLGSGPLLFTNDEETRTLQLGADATVSLLDGESPDPATPGNANNAFLVIASGKTLTVDQAADVFFDSDLSEWVENRTRFQGDITGAGHFVKAGTGYLALSRYAKTLTGSVSIDGGVLDVSAPAALANVSLIDVAQGGQLRLATNGTGVAYAFGGPLHLGSTQRATTGDLQDCRGFGSLGGLRYDPAAGTHSATLSSPVVISADADIHVNGADKTLTLSGALSSSGSYELSRTGGGKLVLAASSTGFNGTLTLLNGATVINATLGNTTTPVSVIVSSTSGAAAPASLSGTGTVNGDVSYAAGSAIIVAAATPVLTIDGDLDLGTAVIDTTGVSTGNYDLFTVTGAKSFGSVSIVGGGSINVSGNTVRLVK